MYSQRLKKIRQKLDLSIAKMAKKLDMPASTLTSYERGDRTPSLDLLSRLYINFKVSANWFVSGEGNMFNHSAQQDEQLEKLVALIVDKKLSERGLV